MCGIVAVLRRRSGRPAPDPRTVVDGLERAVVDLRLGLDALVAPSGRGSGPGGPAALAQLQEVADDLEALDASLRGVPGLQCLVDAGGRFGLGVADQVAAAAAAASDVVQEMEAGLDSGRVALPAEYAEEVNAALLRLKDVTWALLRDRVGTARAVVGLAGVDVLASAHVRAAADAGGAASSGGGAAPTPDRLAALWAIQIGLGSLDRMEVRGRDSAGLHVLVHHHGLDFTDPEVRALLAGRDDDPLFASRAVRTPAGCLSVVYKTAAEIGELGDNIATLRQAVRTDVLLARAIGHPGAEVTVIGHDRWASVGIISEPNAHPLNSDEVDVAAGPYVTAALNGDVDNYADLRLSEALSLPAEVTTDAKVIPTLVSRRLAQGDSAEEAFNGTVARFDGSVAIAASLADTPDQVHLALRGSGQSLFIGLAEDAFVVASEAYGLVEETSAYIRMDGEVTQGQTVVLHRDGAGTLAGMSRYRYGGGVLGLSEADVSRAEITTRDIDRAGFPHFLLKELGEAPRSFRKTLRGRVVTGDGGWQVRLGPDALPRAVVEALVAGTLRRVAVVGQGTAAVAGQAIAAALRRCLPGLDVAALPATELSGFGLADDMGDTLVIAVSQSGSTTDTNRTVDLVRGRGAQVIAVVNRRNSDLAAKSHGVLYTSDGRDIEMSVASTKAFYAQVAAGWLLALAMARAIGRAVPDEDRLVTTLRQLPDAMDAVLAQRLRIGEVAARLAPARKSWAMVGSGPDRVAAAEVRIKLSELCYKAIACDATEDKKHIDLSSEPLILVFAGGLSGPNADDVAKEVAIYRAHKAAPVVVASEGEGERFSAALEVIEVPRCDPELAFVLSAMVGHLFGYHAALAIDAQARPLREARAAIEAATVSSGGAEVGGEAVLAALAPTLAAAAPPLLSRLRSGEYNGHLDVATALDVASLLRFASGTSPLDAYETELGKVGTPSVVVADLFAALSAGIDQLTRPIDAIKHQAKTVTVGISRSEDALLRLRLVKEALAAGAAADQLGYRAMRTLAALDAAVDDVLGYTRYAIEWAAGAPGTDAGPRISVVEQGGVARELMSRTASDHRLRGTKHRAADEREVTVARGRSDGRTVVMVPETRGTVVTGMTLLHVRFASPLTAATARDVLAGYRDRLVALADAVTETERSFDEERLGEVPIVELLTEPVYVLAERWWRR